MKPFLLFSVLSLFIACKSGKKDEPAFTKDTTVIATKTDTLLPVTTGKIDIETFGPLKLGMPYKELVAVLGHPGGKGDAVEWAADGLVHQDWNYPSQGLVLNISFEKDALLQTGKLFSITARSPCTFQTKAGMGLGSTYADIQAAYSRDIDPEATDKTQITVGSVYGGIIFSFTNDKASSIFLGAEAE